MRDLISRQEAKNKKVYSEERHEYVIPVAEIDWLPSAQPEQNKGHWIDEETNYACSECRRGCWVNSDYCPWCGADMRGEKDDKR